MPEVTDDGSNAHATVESADTATAGRRLVPDGGTATRQGAGTAGPTQQYCNNCGGLISANAEICPECGVQVAEAESGGDEPSGRWISAFVGAIVSFFVGSIPFLGPVAGGAVAGYMRGSDTKESALTGTIANVLASIPLVLLFGLFMIFGVIGAASGPGGGEAALGLIVWVLIFGASFLYFWGLGAVGGALGASLSDRRAPN